MNEIEKAEQEVQQSTAEFEEAMQRLGETIDNTTEKLTLVYEKARTTVQTVMKAKGKNPVLFWSVVAAVGTSALVGLCLVLTNSLEGQNEEAPPNEEVLPNELNEKRTPA